jgi:hydroxylamine reductase (hybrid-cluster protein)
MAGLSLSLSVILSPSLPVILSPSLPVILSEAKNLSGRSRVNSAKNLIRMNGWSHA